MVRPLLPVEDEQDFMDAQAEARPVMHAWARIGLIAIAVGLILVFSIALYLNPYRDGRVWTEETHTQLGLPACTFKTVTGLPCPSCGMTTSFSLFIRGDLYHSVQANFVGTLLALACLLYIPWAILSAIAGRPLWVVSVERVLIRLIVVFFALMLLRWAVVLLWQIVF